MASALESQLKALSTSLKSDEQNKAKKKKQPFTKPSLLFDAKEAADVSIQDIYATALEGLEGLKTVETSVASFTNSLFSQESVNIDREQQTKEYNAKLDKSITAFLRCISPHLLVGHSHQLLEYLIRRYKIHVYNVDELLLCALPYHETSLFVRIVQLLSLEKTKWYFLEGVKKSGAPLPRLVFVQQCVRTPSLIQTICEHNTRLRKNQASVHFPFLVAVIVETLGAVKTVDTDLINKFLPFVYLCFQPTSAVDFKVGGLMIVCTLVEKATLSEALTKKFIQAIPRLLQNVGDLERISVLTMSLMVLAKLSQTQSVQQLPRKAIEVLTNFSDLPSCLLELSKTFQLEAFLSLILDGLLELSLSEKSYQNILFVLIDTLNMKSHIYRIVSKVLGASTSSGNIQNDSPEARSRIKCLLMEIEKRYPAEFVKAICDFVKCMPTSNLDSDNPQATLQAILEESLHVPIEVSNTTILMSLEDPKPEIRAAGVSSLAKLGLLNDATYDTKKLINIQEALLKCLHDDDLAVVRSVVLLDGLERVVDDTYLLKALHDILVKCNIILTEGSRDTTKLVYDVACSCMDFLVSKFLVQNPNQSNEVAAIMLPFILIFKKTHRINVKALQSARTIPNSIFSGLSELQYICSDAVLKKLHESCYYTTNSNILGLLSQTLLESPEEHLRWLFEHCSKFYRGKSLIFLILIRSFMEAKGVKFWRLLKGSLPFLKRECRGLACVSLLVQEKPTSLDFFESPDLYEMINSEKDAIHGSLLIALFWSLLDNFPSKKEYLNDDDRSEMLSIFEDLFVLFATSRSKNLFEEHIHLIVTHESLPVVAFLSKFFMEKDQAIPVSVQIESLDALASILRALSTTESSEMNGIQGSDLLSWQLALPCVMVPLCSAVLDVRVSATECIHALHDLCSSMKLSLQKFGIEEVYEQYLPVDVFERLTESIVQVKKSFDSDGRFLGSFLRSIIGLSVSNISVPENFQDRFDDSSKEAIYLFILRNCLNFPTYAKCSLLSALQGAGHEDKLVIETKDLLSQLLQRRKICHLKHDTTLEGLSYDEVQLISILIKSYMLYVLTSSTSENVFVNVAELIFEALNVEDIFSEDIAVIKPCITILESINSRLYDSQAVMIQDQLFQHLILLYSSDIGVVRNAAMDALQRINVNGTNVAEHIDQFCKWNSNDISVRKCKKRKVETKSCISGFVIKEGLHFKFVNALLEFLSWKKDLKNRLSVVGSLFRLLDKIINDGNKGLVSGSTNATENTPKNVGSEIDNIHFQEQIVMTVLEDIIDSESSENDIMATCNEIDVDLIVQCLSLAKDSTTRNHAVKLLIAVAKRIPDKVLSHVLDVFTVMGESTIIQEDSHSQHVSEQLISAIAPKWLFIYKEPQKLLKVFMRAVPKMSTYRRLAIIKHVLRVLDEERSLPTFLWLLLEETVVSSSSKSSEKSTVSNMETNWALEFAKQLGAHYPLRIWLSSLITLLDVASSHGDHKFVCESVCKNGSLMWMLHIKATDLASEYLINNNELPLELESESEHEVLQVKLIDLMERAVLQLQTLDNKDSCCNVDSNLKKGSKKASFRLLNGVTSLLPPVAYSKGITSLLKHSDVNVRQKGLQLLCENLRDSSDVVYQPLSQRGVRIHNFAVPNWDLIGKEGEEALIEMLLEIAKLVQAPVDEKYLKLKLSALSALSIIATKFPGKFSGTFAKCLEATIKNLSLSNLGLSSECLQCIASLILDIGPQALAQLPTIMKFLLEGAQTFHSEAYREFFTSVLCALESIVKSLGGFLNPYLEEIITVLVLYSPFTANTKSVLCVKAASIRNLISKNIPVRLLVGPIIKVYERTMEKGESSIAALFEIAAAVVSKMDRSSVAAYHTKFFDFFMSALDLRRQRPKTVIDIEKAEKSVINALVSLTMKLSETTFRPLFIRALDWAESEIESEGSSSCRNIERNVSFYGFVDSLAGNLRSVFVPYFQYLIDGCIYHLTRGQDQGNDGMELKHKKKKIKLASKTGDVGSKQVLSESVWHLRKLVISSLHKCFLYDTLGFLDNTRFQMLLKPIVSQLVVDPPKSLDDASVDQVDDLLVSCLVQMALTSGSDLLWKHLNHEVLMQTRSERVRARTLGLRIVKCLVEHLKEEYLVLLPETIPFLGELLEDSELHVVAKAQEIFKYLEELSGESLQQYL